MSTKRIKLVVAYDGTDFCGWAAQHGQRTVHSTLTEAVRRVSGERIEITGASRTDSGAHAKGQVCHFDADIAIPPERWAYALNKVLPRDVSIVRSAACPFTFHSRFWAKSRRYRYRILNAPRDACRARYVHEQPRPVDLEAMVGASQALCGKHDFRSYSQELEPGTNAVRELFSVEVRRSRDEIWLDVVGTAFLRGMMRRMAGVLLEVGLGQRPEAEVAALLDTESRHRLQLPVVLPARGLCLMEIRYLRGPHTVLKPAERPTERD